MPTKDRKWLGAIIGPDLTGQLKMDTLEFFVINFGWHTAKDLYHDPIIEGLYMFGSGWRCLSVRLLRYHRSGLLARRRRLRAYEYCITEKGEDRLFYLWHKLGYLDIESQPTDSARELAVLRVKKAKSILEKRMAVIEAEWTSDIMERRIAHMTERKAAIIEEKLRMERKAAIIEEKFKLYYGSGVV